MSAGTLGPGARVWIGWAPDHTIEPDAIARGSRCRTGTVVDGPFPPGSVLYVPKQQFIPYTGFTVKPDDLDGSVFIDEAFLFPIDDGEAARERRRREHDEWVAAGRPVPKVMP